MGGVNMAKKKQELDVFEQANEYLSSVAKAAHCSGERWERTQETLNGYTVGIYLEAPEGTKLVELLEE